MQSTDHDSETIVKQYSQIEMDLIDRYGYKRAYSNKAKLRFESQVAERILGSLAKEASG